MKLFFIYFLLPLLTSAQPSGEISSSDYSTVVIVPDIHGDSESFLRSLWLAYNDAISTAPIPYEDFKTHFPDDTIVIPIPLTRNPDIVLVQLGDIFDRGPHGLRCLYILELIPIVLGWKVVRIYGNHEIMNHVGGAQHYIHPLEALEFTKAFSSGSSVDVRNREFQNGGSVWQSIINSTVLVARFGPHPPDHPDGDDVPPIHSSSTLFVHAGVEILWVENILKRHGKSGDAVHVVNSLNEITHKLVSSPPILDQSDIYNSFESLTMRQSPLWIRDMARIDEEFACEVLLPPILKKFQTARIIVGHTADTDSLKVRSLCGSRIILADAAMSRWMVQSNWLATDLDPSAPATTDYLGRPALGNPTVLMMRQAGNTLIEIKSLNLNITASMIEENQIYPELSPALFIAQANPAAYKANLLGGLIRDDRNMFSTLTGSFRAPPATTVPTGGLYRADVHFENIGQRLGGTWRYRFMDDLRRRQARGKSRSYGIPFIPFVSSPDPVESWFYAIYQTNGVPLREIIVSEMTFTLHLVRQIFIILRDLRREQLCIDLGPGLVTDSSIMLDMYILEQHSELVKLVDFSKVFKMDAGVCISDFAMYLSMFTARLVRIANSKAVNDHIPFVQVIGEVFGPDVFTLAPEAKLSETIRDLLEAWADIAPSGRSSASDVSYILNDDSGEPFGLIEPPLAQILAIKRSIPLISSMNGAAEIIYTSNYPDGVTLVQMADSVGGTGWAAYRQLRSTMRIEEFGVPQILDMQHRLDDSVFFILNITGQVLSTVYFDDADTIHASVYDQIKSIFEKILGMGVVAGFKDMMTQSAAFAMLDMFMINEAKNEVKLFFLPDLRLVKGPSEAARDEALCQEMAQIIAALDCLFVSKCLTSSIRGTVILPGLVDEGDKPSHGYGTVVSQSLPGFASGYGHFTEVEVDESAFASLPFSTKAVAAQPTTVLPTGSFRVNLRSSQFGDILEQMTQPTTVGGER